MSYNISVDEENRIINITWNGALDFSILKRFVLSYNYHITHTDHHLLYDFTKVSDLVLAEEDMSQVADLARQVFDPLLKNVKVAMLTANPEIAALTRSFVSMRKNRSEGAPSYDFFEDFDQAINWLKSDG